MTLRAVNADICKQKPSESTPCTEYCNIHLQLLRNKKRCPKTHYLVIVMCGNCEYPNIVTVPKGVPADEFLKNINCRYCDCALTYVLQDLNIDDGW